MQYSYWSTESRRQEYWRTQTENHIQSELLWYHSARCSKSGKLYQAQVRMESLKCVLVWSCIHIFLYVDNSTLTYFCGYIWTCKFLNLVVFLTCEINVLVYKIRVTFTLCIGIDGLPGPLHCMFLEDCLVRENPCDLVLKYKYSLRLSASPESKPQVFNLLHVYLWLLFWLSSAHVYVWS